MKLLYAHCVKYLLVFFCFFLFIVPVAGFVALFTLLTIPIATFIQTVNRMTASTLNTLDEEIDKQLVTNKIREVKEKYIKDI